MTSQKTDKETSLVAENLDNRKESPMEKPKSNEI